MNSDNQILKSYYIMNNLFTNEELNEILCDDEKLWFVNYHCLLKKSQMHTVSDDTILRYLVPKYALSKEIKKNTYLSFYKINIENGVSFISSYENIKISIKDYIDKKIEERKNAFQNPENTEYD